MMGDLFAVQAFRHLFLAQVIALVGTGLSSVALGLMAYAMAGGSAALILGGVFAVKMICYVTVAPIAGAIADRWPRRRVLVLLDLLRASAALCLPFVNEVWQIFALIVVLQAASAGFTPLFQATIPDILPDEAEYTRALSLSRLAYDLEAMLSPLLAAALLTVLSFPALFAGTAIGFVASALLVSTALLPRIEPGPSRPVYERTTRGVRLYLATPRLRGLLALNLAVASAGAMVLVNTVVLVQGDLGLAPRSVAFTMGAFGAGSMATALILPRVLARLRDRPVMMQGAGLMGAALICLALAIGVMGLSWPVLLVVWAFVGAGYSAVLTPSGRLLRRSAHTEDRPALFAAQFALSHACWLLAYPLAGALMTSGGAVLASLVLGGLALFGLGLARRLWPRGDPEVMIHSHPDLPPDHPHLLGAPGEGHANAHDHAHAHAYVIDDLHPRWPGSGGRARRAERVRALTFCGARCLRRPPVCKALGCAR